MSANTNLEVPSAGHEHHVHPVKMYVTVYLMLMALLVVTVLASFVHFGPLNIVIAMLIAIFKAAVVVLYFMNVKFSSKLTWIWAAIGFLWFILLFITLMDYASRDYYLGF